MSDEKPETPVELVTGRPESTGASSVGERPVRPRQRAPAAARPCRQAGSAAGPPAAPVPDLAGKTTSVASAGGAAAQVGCATRRGGDEPASARPRRHVTASDTPRVDWPRVGRVLRGLGGRSGGHRPLHVPQRALRAAAAVQGRLPERYGVGVDERWKDKFGVWIVREPDDVVAQCSRVLRAARDLHAPRLHAELAGRGEQVQVPVPRQRLLHDGHQLRGPGAAAARARPHRARRRRPDPGRQGAEVPVGAGQWTDPEAFLKA